MPPLSESIDLLRLGHPPEGDRITLKRRLFIWGGACLALLGSLLILFLGWKQSSADLRQLIEAAAARNGLNADLVDGVVYAESRGNAKAVSRAQAYGLMQLRVPTASEMAGRDVTVDELFDPHFNLELGCRYLKKMLDLHDGNVVLALMAYNAGPGNVSRWMARNPDPMVILKAYAFDETRGYVRKVLNHVRTAK